MLSIVTITKDNPEAFKQTARSIREQTALKNIQWVVVNGSTESKDIENIIQSYGADVAWSQSKPDKGLYDAMNIGLAQTKGEWVQFLNAGDRLHGTDIVESFFRIINADSDVDFIYGDYFYVEHFRCARMFEQYRNKKMPTSHQAMFFRRDLAQAHTYDITYRVASDVDYFFRYSEKIAHPYYWQRPIIVFEGGGVSEKKFAKAAKELFDIRHERGVSLQENIVMTGSALIGGCLKTIAPQLSDRLWSLWNYPSPPRSDAPDLSLSP